MDYEQYEKASCNINSLEDKALEQLENTKNLKVSTAIKYMWPDAYKDGRNVEVVLPGYRSLGLRRAVTRAKTYNLVSRKPFMIEHPKKVRRYTLRDTPVALINHICDKYNARDTYRGELYKITVWDNGQTIEALFVRNGPRILGMEGMHKLDIKAIVKDQTGWDIKDPDFKWDVNVQSYEPRMIQSLDDRQRLVLNIFI